MLSKLLGHFKTITKHKWIVLKLCFKAGIFWQGVTHDFSKYSPTEFFESVKYYTGTRSPIFYCKQKNGYSKAWLHHKGRNKHHYEYWNDLDASDFAPIIPYKYAVEMVCDTLAAGIVYQGKNWNIGYQKKYFNEKGKSKYINPKIIAFLDEVYDRVEMQGIDKTINKKSLKCLYYSLIKPKTRQEC